MKTNDFPSIHSKVTVVILAGGFGTRLRHILKDLPKPMAYVAGRPFLEWVIRYFKGQGFERFIISTGYKSEVIERYFTKQPVPNTKVVCVPEVEPLGTAGGFLNAVRASGVESYLWLVVNGDSLILTNLNSFILKAANDSAGAAVLALSVQDTDRFGTVEVDKRGLLVRFAEKRPGKGLINAGVYAFKSNTLNLFPNRQNLSFEFDVFPCFATGIVDTLVDPVDAPFLDIGTPVSLASAERFIHDNQSQFI